MNAKIPENLSTDMFKASSPQFRWTVYFLSRLREADNQAAAINPLHYMYNIKFQASYSHMENLQLRIYGQTVHQPGTLA